MSNEFRQNARSSKSRRKRNGDGDVKIGVKEELVSGRRTGLPRSGMGDSPEPA